MHGNFQPKKALLMKINIQNAKRPNRKKQQFSWQYLHLYLHIEIVVTEPYCLLFAWIYSSEVQYQRYWIMLHVTLYILSCLNCLSSWFFNVYVFCIRCSLIYTSNRKLQCCRWQWYTNVQNRTTCLKFPYKNLWAQFCRQKMLEMSNCHTFYEFEIFVVILIKL